jgi:hypothetical protein
MLLLAIRFLVELAGVAALAFVGATAPSDPVLRVVLGISAPLALVVIWALAVAPKADNPLPLRARELIGTGLLVLVAAALVVTGQPGWGIALAGVVLVDQALILATGADAIMRAANAAPEGTH